MDEKELIIKFKMFEQQANHLQQQIQAIEEGINDLDRLNISLNELKESKDKEIMAPIGRGIFLKAKILSDDLLVDVGNKSLVKKSISQTQKILEKQGEKLESIKTELKQTLEILGEEITRVIQESQGKETK